MKILIAGATGLVGRAFVNHFHNQYQFGFIGRNIAKINKTFDLSHESYDWPMIENNGANILKEYDAIINLSGENIGEKRWSDEQKKKILNSRVRATQLLATKAADSQNKSLHFLNASAIGSYDFATGNDTQFNCVFTETSALPSPPQSFVAQVGAAWEAALQPAINAGLAVTIMRFGVVLAKEGGALAKLLPSFKLGMGATLGTGHQPFSWIAINDLIDAIHFLLQHKQLTGPINLVAPEVISQQQFAKTLAKVLHRPCLMTMPNFAVNIMFGEMANELLLNGQNVSSEKLQNESFKFKFPQLEEALQHLLQG